MVPVCYSFQVAVTRTAVTGGGLISVAKKFTDLGYVCVSLTYRTPRPQGLPIYQSGWQDGQRAVRLVRQSAKQRGFRTRKNRCPRILCWWTPHRVARHQCPHPGLRSGGCQSDEIPCHVNLAVPIYVAYALTDGLTGPNTRSGGNTIDAKLSDVFKFDCKDLPYGSLSWGNGSLFPSLVPPRFIVNFGRMKIPSRGPPLCRPWTRLYGGPE